MTSLLPLCSRSAALVVIALALIGLAHAGSESKSLPPLPEPVTSFGAVTQGGTLYVFGGHKGGRHDYSADQVSGSFHRLNLQGGTAWESLAAAAPGQGLPLVAHGDSVYRVGGMVARNAAGGKQDLISLAVVQRFDGVAGRWRDGVPLPEPRSSHDAVVIGDRLYVVGGWQMRGGTNTPVWPDTGLVLDLGKPSADWATFPQPFRRRALAAAVEGDRIVCVGGMDADGAPTLAVDFYDTVAGTWTRGPELPAGKFKGFACSAVTQSGRVYANTFQGDLLRLSADRSAWEVVGRLEHPRMAHRLVAAEAGGLIALGGEDGDSKRPDLELLTPSPRALERRAAPAAGNP